jgi:NhaA family Na+:H+ antiporter
VSPTSSPQPFVERLLAPFQRFASVASAGGIVLLVATIIAMVWANSPWAVTYHRLWETPISIGAGALNVRSTLHHVISDGLMAVFFFLVGLEIKREVLAGELKSRRTAALPMLGAVGGMLVPAVLFAIVNIGGSGIAGWGVPMATDIAFALGVLALLGERVPIGLKVFLAALAIIDDIGAILVIAIFYSGGVSWLALAAAVALVGLSVGANAAGVRQPSAYGALGIGLWVAMSMSGVHATVAGVLLAMTIPVGTRIDERAFLDHAQRALKDFDAAAVVTAADPDVTVLSNTNHHTALEDIATLAEQAQPPLIRIERSLHGIVSFGIMPLFALANAGVSLSGDALRAELASPVTLGVVIGLVLGKPIGITIFSLVGVRWGIAVLPPGVSWPILAGASVLGGIGFTMSMFIARLAFPDVVTLETAKLGILIASAVAGLTGWFVLLRLLRSPLPAPAIGVGGRPDQAAAKASEQR